jgi:hypothetical protein
MSSSEYALANQGVVGGDDDCTLIRRVICAGRRGGHHRYEKGRYLLLTAPGVVQRRRHTTALDMQLCCGQRRRGKKMARARKRKMKNLQHDDAPWIKICCADGAMGLCCGQYGVSECATTTNAKSRK